MLLIPRWLPRREAVGGFPASQDSKAPRFQGSKVPRFQDSKIPRLRLSGDRSPIASDQREAKLVVMRGCGCAGGLVCVTVSFNVLFY